MERLRAKCFLCQQPRWHVLRHFRRDCNGFSRRWQGVCPRRFRSRRQAGSISEKPQWPAIARVEERNGEPAAVDRLLFARDEEQSRRHRRSGYGGNFIWPPDANAASGIRISLAAQQGNFLRPRRSNEPAESIGSVAERPPAESSRPPAESQNLGRRGIRHSPHRAVQDTNLAASAYR